MRPRRRHLYCQFWCDGNRRTDWTELRPQDFDTAEPLTLFEKPAGRPPADKMRNDPHVRPCRGERTVSTLETIRRALYFSQRTIGDYQAARRGPDKLAKRLIRRAIVRAIFRGL